MELRQGGNLTRVEDWVNGEPEFLSSNWDQSFIMSSSMYFLAALAMFCNMGKEDNVTHVMDWIYPYESALTSQF